jgi:hypothetical protein
MQAIAIMLVHIDKMEVAKIEIFQTILLKDQVHLEIITTHPLISVTFHLLQTSQTEVIQSLKTPQAMVKVARKPPP